MEGNIIILKLQTIEMIRISVDVKSDSTLQCHTTTHNRRLYDVRRVYGKLHKKRAKNKKD